MKKEDTEFKRFDRVMDGLLSVPYKELQQKLEEEKKARARKKRTKTSPASRVSDGPKS